MSSTTFTLSSEPSASPTQATVAVGFVAGAAKIDVGLMSLAFSMASLLLITMTWKLVSAVFGGAVNHGKTSSSSSKGSFSITLVAFIASAFLEVKSAVALTYTLTLWLNPQFRYFSVYFMLHCPMVLLYFLYEQRLGLLFSLNKKVGTVVLMWTLRFLIILYFVVTVVTTGYFIAYAKNTATGGYGSSPPQAWYLKLILYIADVSIDAVILCGTFVALLEILQAQTAIGSRGKPIFQAILGSDCFRFLIIAAIEAYKLANTTDPTALLGTLPTGNTGFQHVIDNLKVILMTANLFAPAAVAKVVVSVNSSSPSKSDSRNGPSSTNVAVSAPGISLNADSTA